MVLVSAALTISGRDARERGVTHHRERTHEQQCVEDAAEQVAQEHPEEIGEHFPWRQFSFRAGERQDGETARGQFEAEDDDHDEADWENERADEWRVRLAGGGEGEARRIAEQRAGEEPADEQVLRGERALGRPGGDHGFDDFEWFDVVHGGGLVVL